MKHEDLRVGMKVRVISDGNLGARWNENTYIKRGDVLEIIEVYDVNFSFKNDLGYSNFYDSERVELETITTKAAPMGQHKCHCDDITFSRYGCRCGGC